MAGCRGVSLGNTDDLPERRLSVEFVPCIPVDGQGRDDYVGPLSEPRVVVCPAQANPRPASDVTRG